MNNPLPPTEFLHECLEFAEQLKNTARSVVMSATSEKLEVATKTDKSFVTSLDTQLERILRDAILKRYPNHGIIGEELGTINPSAEFIWTIDPIDGTEELVYGIPLYGTIISLLHNMRPILGLIDHPALNICTIGAIGMGAFRNGKKLLDLGAVNDPARLYLGSRHQFLRGWDDSEKFNVVSKRIPNVRIFCTCYGFTGLFNGEADVAVESNLKIWDLAAAEVLVKEVGGEFVKIGEQVLPSGLRLYGAVFGKKKLVGELVSMIDTA